MEQWNSSVEGGDAASPEVSESSYDAFSGTPSDAKVSRFYDRIRSRIGQFLERRGPAGRVGEFLLLVPDVFILLWRLVNDKRVTGNNKMLLGTGIAYYFFPLDIIPEAFTGPVGFLDDLVFGAFILNKMLNDTEEIVLRQNWSGKGDVLDMIRRVLAAADQLATTDFVRKVKRFVR